MKILVTGGTGFLGMHLRNRFDLESIVEVSQVYYAGSRHCDLRNQAATISFLAEHQFDQVIHLAASVGGIGANMHNPGKFCYENLIMGTNIIEAARITHVKKIVCVGTVCSYPKFCDVPFMEDDLWKGYPEETNAPYGVAKKALLELLKGYHTQYGMDYTFLIPVNMYGEFDNFDPASSHVIPALVDKIIEAKRTGKDTIKVWGTGKATREFVHAADVSKALYLATKTDTGPEPINVGSGEEVAICDLVDMIAEAAEWCGKIEYESDKPDGQPRRLISSQRAKDKLGYEPSIPLKEGLKRLVAWREATS